MNDATKTKPRVQETHPTPCETVANANLIVDTNPLPDDGRTISVSKENIDYPDTRIKLQLDSPHKQSVDKNGTYKADSQQKQIDTCSPTVEDTNPPSIQEQLQMTCTRGDFRHLSEFLAQSKLLYPVAGITESELPELVATDNDTITNSELTNFHLLHIASAQGYWKLIFLLLAYGADPAVKDQQGRLSYNLARDKKTRDSFRKFMGKYPEAFDYIKAQVGLTIC